MGRTLFSAQAKFISHFHNFAVAEMDLDELGTAYRFAVFVFQRRDKLLGFRVKDIGRMAPRITSVQAETHPAMTSFG